MIAKTFNFVNREGSWAMRGIWHALQLLEQQRYEQGSMVLMRIGLVALVQKAVASIALGKGCWL
ncbi:hypothetical protein [Ectopseudomonas oleovorans]|uniref:hypothetical protein n=1 Tax=Ectopseudomonas oleovorans TaxID=301 RepID=UPI000E6AE0A6|nr:hypothetical protein [Pseudomonas oleovorans]